MEKEFIPYAEALALKELGFDEPCFATFFSVGAWQIDYVEGTLNLKSNTDGEYSILAPLCQQAFKWFREKYNLFVQVNIHTYFIYDISNDEFKMIKQYDKLTKTYEEAELECLKKLIEIVKEKK
jgi:hypothetical protein